MTQKDAELVSRIKNRLGENDDSKTGLVYEFLQEAQSEILSRRFPYGEYPAEFPKEYENLAVKLAVVLYNKMGAEGENSHSENGVGRSYETIDELLYTVVPKVGVIGK